MENHILTLSTKNGIAQNYCFNHIYHMKKSTFVLILAFIILCLLVACLLPEQTEDSFLPSSQTSPLRPPTELSGFCLAGCPVGSPASDQLVVHHILELENNPTTKFADWVAYKITAETMGSGCKRIWKIDPDLDTSSTLTPSDYKDIRNALVSDRGHQAPLASLCGSPDWQEADYLSNITPQKTDLNEGAWERLENGERSLVTHHKATAVYSLTGPLYERKMEKLSYAHRDHTVPSGYWKIISLIENNKIEAIAFLMDQETPRETDFCSTKVTIGDIEKRAHLKFFPDLGDPARSSLENGTEEGPLLTAVGC